MNLQNPTVALIDAVCSEDEKMDIRVAVVLIIVVLLLLLTNTVWRPE
jgi:hypothetical protein